MSRNDEAAISRTERVKHGLMVCCALILFVLGVWLLIEPVKARGAEKVDNVLAADASLAARGAGWR